MPSMTLTPDLPATRGQPAPPEPPEPPVSSGLRLITVPAGWPPYDCEIHGAACPMAREAVTNPQVSSQAAGLAEPTAPPPAPSQDRTPDAPARAARANAAAPADAPGQAAAFPRRFAQVIVEILAGSRPPRQIVPWTTDRVRAQVDLLSQALASDQRPRIRRIMTSRPAAHVVEMTVVVNFGPRSRALAMRFEHVPARQPAPGLPGRPARWLCTEIETG
jgi:hypothetical protein